MNEGGHDETLSKTKRKQLMHDLQGLGEALVDLPRNKLDQLDLPETLFDAVMEARRITAHGGKRRQLQYVGKLMRGIDPVPIQAKLDQWSNGHAQETALLHRLENWRQRLIEDDNALSELLQTHADFDLQQLRTLIRNARKEAQLSKPPRSSRELFRLLRDTLHPPL